MLDQQSIQQCREIAPEQLKDNLKRAYSKISRSKQILDNLKKHKKLEKLVIAMEQLIEE
ncbi:MAG TPA: hypothetical protein V6C71_08500 [Coleofasciculaceae cyanobacterium]